MHIHPGCHLFLVALFPLLLAAAAPPPAAARSSWAAEDPRDEGGVERVGTCCCAEEDAEPERPSPLFGDGTRGNEGRFLWNDPDFFSRPGASWAAVVAGISPPPPLPVLSREIEAPDAAADAASAMSFLCRRTSAYGTQVD
jgi:hypothetical protein